MHHVQAAAGGLGQGDVAAGHHVFGGGGDARQAQHQRDQPFVHHAALGQLADLGVVEHRLVEHQAIFEGPPHQLGVVDRGAVVAEGDRPGLDQLADLGQLLSLAVLADAGRRRRRWQWPAWAAWWWTNSTVPWLSMGGSVLGMQAIEVKPPASGGRRAGVDRLVLLEARLAEVHVHVDQPGRDDPAARRRSPAVRPSAAAS